MKKYLELCPYGYNEFTLGDEIKESNTGIEVCGEYKAIDVFLEDDFYFENKYAMINPLLYANRNCIEIIAMYNEGVEISLYDASNMIMDDLKEYYKNNIAGMNASEIYFENTLRHKEMWINVELGTFNYKNQNEYVQLDVLEDIAKIVDMLNDAYKNKQKYVSIK